MLNPLQQKLLDMLAWFHEFCEENEINYYVCGGTLLGAVRHGGFIPWDDDIDVMLPRPDYEKLRSVFGEQQGNYILESPDSPNADYLYSFTKLYDTTTTLTERTKCNCTRGVYLDIFPLDGLGKTEQECKKNFSKFDRLNKFKLTRTCAIRKGRSLYKNMAILLARIIPDFIVNDKKLTVAVDELASEHDYEQSEYVASLMGAYLSKEIFQKRILGTPQKVAFENIQVYAVEDCDAYLTQLYGEWRKLPPEEKRVSHHLFTDLDLEHSFLVEGDEKM